MDSYDNGNIMYSYDGISWSDSVGGTSFIRKWIRVNCLRNELVWKSYPNNGKSLS